MEPSARYQCFGCGLALIASQVDLVGGPYAGSEQFREGAAPVVLVGPRHLRLANPTADVTEGGPASGCWCGPVEPMRGCPQVPNDTVLPAG